MARTRQKDFYRTLGVKPGASDEQIKQAYRGLARRYHPDVNRGNRYTETRFKEINEAYAVLGDPAKRKEYDSAISQPTTRPSSSVRTYPRKPPPHGSVHVNISRNSKPGRAPGAAGGLDVTISGLTAGLGVADKLLSRLNEVLAAAERAASGQPRSPKRGPDADKKS